MMLRMTKWKQNCWEYSDKNRMIGGCCNVVCDEGKEEDYSDEGGIEIRRDATAFYSDLNF